LRGLAGRKKIPAHPGSAAVCPSGGCGAGSDFSSDGRTTPHHSGNQCGGDLVDIQRLQIEPISQASARQRRGRCGRVGPGVCVRLYAEEDFASRPEFTTPEILRSNLAGVVLQMEHLGLGDPLEFPFVDPPQPKRIAQAYRVLEEIGAIHKKGKHTSLTKVGETLARLPLDPRIGRILVGARDEGCLAEGLVIAAALTVPDPRERPQDKQQAADEAHARFRDNRSDFTGWLRLWHGIAEASNASGNQLRRFCERQFLNHRRVREWGQLHRELRQTLRELRWALPDAKAAMADPADTYNEPLHRAILASIPSHIGMNLGKKLGYQGEGGRAFFVFPGSGVFASSPAWVMAFEKVETAKLYARNVAMFDPGWMEKVAPHLCRYRYSNPHWVAEQGAVYGEERVLAFGLPVVEKRRIHYGRVDRVVARKVFLLEALVLGNTKAPLAALSRNRATLQEAEKLEHKVRRSGGLLHPTAVEDWYEEKLPATICTQKEFEQWVSKAPAGILDFALEDCLSEVPGELVLDDYPNALASPEGEVEFALSYLHLPGDPADGISLELPLVELPTLPAWYGDWLVPGWLGEKVGVLLRCLHKDLRTLLPSNREVADDFVADWEGYVPEVSLLEALIDTLRETHGVNVSEESFSLERMPEHLRMRFVVVDDQGRVLGASRDLSELQERLAGKLRDRFARVAKGRFDRSGLTSWSFGDLPEEYALDHRTPGYPRLFDAGSRGVGLRLWPSAATGDCQHRRGVAALFEKVSSTSTRRLTEMLQGAIPRSSATPRPAAAPAVEGFASLAAAFGGNVLPAKQALGAAEKKVSTGQGALTWTRENLWLLDQLGSAPGRAVVDLRRRLLADQLGSPMTQSAWEEAVARVEVDLWDMIGNVLEQLRRILGVAENVGTLLSRKDSGYEESLADAREQFQSLFAPGWLLSDDFGLSLIHIQGLEMRLTRMFGSAPGKDAAKLAEYRKAIVQNPVKETGTSCLGHCEVCPVGLLHRERRQFEADLRLQYFAPELRAKLR
jgi:RNA helicase HrpA